MIHVNAYGRLARASYKAQTALLMPFLLPFVTITNDSLASYGIEECGGGLHDLLGMRCDFYVNRMLTGEDFHHHCHSDLTRAALQSDRTRCA